MAAGSIVCTNQVFADKHVRPVRMLSLLWTSDASGNCNGNKTDGSGTITFSGGGVGPAKAGFISGLIMRVAFIPGTSGVQPSNNYTALLLDGNGLDLLSGVPTANLSATTPSDLIPSCAMKDGVTISTGPRAIDDILELQISGAGNAKSGTVVVYLR